MPLRNQAIRAISSTHRILWGDIFLFTALALSAQSQIDLSQTCSDSPTGKIVIPAGQYTPSTSIQCSVQGAGIRQTTIKPTKNLPSSLFFPPSSGKRQTWSDMTIDMSNVPAQAVESWVNLSFPNLNDVEIVGYPCDGTATVAALSKQGSGGVTANHVYIKCAGKGISIQGDNHQEDYCSNMPIESAGICYELIRTPPGNDVGGQYLQGVKCTNPYNVANSKGFVLNSLESIADNPVFLNESVADNMQGGHGISVNNWNGVYSSNNWFTTAKSGLFGGIHVKDSMNAFFYGPGRVAGATQDIVLDGTLLSVVFDGLQSDGNSVNNTANVSLADTFNPSASNNLQFRNMRFSNHIDSCDVQKCWASKSDQAILASIPNSSILGSSNGLWINTGLKSIYTKFVLQEPGSGYNVPMHVTKDGELEFFKSGNTGFNFGFGQNGRLTYGNTNCYLQPLTLKVMTWTFCEPDSGLSYNTGSGVGAFEVRGASVFAFSQSGIDFRVPITVMGQTLFDSSLNGNLQNLTVGGKFIAIGAQIWTRSDRGSSSEFCLINQAQDGMTPKKCLRVGQNGELQLLNDAHTAIVFTIDDLGNATVPGAHVTGSLVAKAIEAGDITINGRPIFNRNGAMAPSQLALPELPAGGVVIAQGEEPTLGVPSTELGDCFLSNQKGKAPFFAPCPVDPPLHSWTLPVTGSQQIGFASAPYYASASVFEIPATGVVFDTITAVTLVPDPQLTHFYALQIADINGTLRCTIPYGISLNKIGAVHFRCKEGTIFLPRDRYVMWWSSNVAWGTRGRSSTGTQGTTSAWGPTARLLGSGTSAGQYLTSYYSASQGTAVMHGALASAVPIFPRYGTVGDIPLFQLHDSSEN